MPVDYYFGARLADQFDAVIHLHETRALQLLEITSEWETAEVPEHIRARVRNFASQDRSIGWDRKAVI